MLHLHSIYACLNDVDKTLLHILLEDLDKAFINFYEERESITKFKCKSHHDKYRTNCIYCSYKGNNYANTKIDFGKKKIKFSNKY